MHIVDKKHGKPAATHCEELPETATKSANSATLYHFSGENQLFSAETR